MAVMLADLDGAFVVRVAVDDDGSTRDRIYRSVVSAELAVRRAEKRGREATAVLCRLVPVGEALL